MNKQKGESLPALAAILAVFAGRFAVGRLLGREINQRLIIRKRERLLAGNNIHQ